jgi:hypothetical protein
VCMSVGLWLESVGCSDTKLFDLIFEFSRTFKSGALFCLCFFDRCSMFGKAPAD